MSLKVSIFCAYSLALYFFKNLFITTAYAYFLLHINFFLTLCRRMVWPAGADWELSALAGSGDRRSAVPGSSRVTWVLRQAVGPVTGGRGRRELFVLFCFVSWASWYSEVRNVSLETKLHFRVLSYVGHFMSAVIYNLGNQPYFCSVLCFDLFIDFAVKKIGLVFVYIKICYLCWFEMFWILETNHNWVKRRHV